MKKSILSVLIATLFVFNYAIAQEEEENQGLKGAWWLLGQLEYSNDEGNDVESFTVLPVVGTFVSPTVTVGLGAGYTSTQYGSYDECAFIVMPLVRNYWSINDKLYIFGQADVPLLFMDGATGYGLNISPGIDYFLSNKLTIEATFGQLGYNVVKPDGGDAVGTTSLGVNLFDINFGLKLVL